MNATEQRNHKRRTDELEQNIIACGEEFATHLQEVERDLREAIGDERTHRLKLADEQRSYVDARDRELRQCCQERWGHGRDTQAHL